MEGKTQTRLPAVELGVNVAALVQIDVFSVNRYQSDEIERAAFLTWRLDPDEDGRERTLRDSFIRLPVTWDGYPALNEKSKFYNRLSAVYGERFAVDRVRWTLELPEPYNSPEGLEAVPHWDERNTDGFEPVTVKSVTVEGVELLGRSAYIEVAQRGEYLRIVGANPMPRNEF